MSSVLECVYLSLLSPCFKVKCLKRSSSSPRSVFPCSSVQLNDGIVTINALIMLCNETYNALYDFTNNYCYNIL